MRQSTHPRLRLVLSDHGSKRILVHVFFFMSMTFESRKPDELTTKVAAGERLAVPISHAWGKREGFEPEYSVRCLGNDPKLNLSKGIYVRSTWSESFPCFERL